MNDFLVEEIEQVIKSVSNKEVSPELSSVIFCLGRDAENEAFYSCFYRNNHCYDFNFYSPILI